MAKIEVSYVSRRSPPSVAEARRSPMPTETRIQRLNSKELIAEFLGGDDSAFAEVLDLERPRLFTVVWSLFGRAPEHYDDAADVCQEALLKAWSARNGFRGDSTAATWLTSIARREYVSFWRKSNAGKRIPREILTNIDLVIEDKMSLGIETSECLGKRIDREQIVALIQNEIRAIPEVSKTRRILELRLDGLNCSQIASRIDDTPDRVKSLMSTAVKRLKSLAKQHGWEY